MFEQFQLLDSRPRYFAQHEVPRFNVFDWIMIQLEGFIHQTDHLINVSRNCLDVVVAQVHLLDLAEFVEIWRQCFDEVVLQNQRFYAVFIAEFREDLQFVAASEDTLQFQIVGKVQTLNLVIINIEFAHEGEEIPGEDDDLVEGYIEFLQHSEVHIGEGFQLVVADV